MTMIEARYGVSAAVTNDACNGEDASQFLTAVSGRPPESAAVHSGYNLVFLTFGGDDVDFRDIVADCLIALSHSAPDCIEDLDDAVADLKGGIASSPVAATLSRDLQYIHAHAPGAKIVLLGYPYLESDAYYTLTDRGEGSNSVAGDACGEREGTTNIVTVGQCLYEIGNLGEQIQRQLIAKLNGEDQTSNFVFVSTQKLFAGTQPGFPGPNHELTATGVNSSRWFVQPFVDADSGLQGHVGAAANVKAHLGSGVDVFYHPNPTGWDEEAKLLMATPAVVGVIASPSSATARAKTTGTPDTGTQTTRTPASASSSFSGVASDQEGDRVAVTVGLGTPARMSRIAGPVGTCDSAVEAQQSSPTRSIAIPVTVTMTILSSLAANVTVSVDGFGFVTSGGDVDEDGEETLSSAPLWVGAYSTGSTCDAWSDPGAGVVDWSATAVSPHSTQTWSAWLIIPNAVSPDDPSGLNAAHRLVIQPGVGVSGGLPFNLTPSQPASPGIVTCYSESDLIPGDAPFLALDPSAVISDGCTRGDDAGSTGDSGNTGNTGSSTD